MEREGQCGGEGQGVKWVGQGGVGGAGCEVGGVSMKWVECGVGGAVWRGGAGCEVGGTGLSGRGRVREDCVGRTCFSTVL